MLPTLMVIVDTSVVNVALDHIRGSFSAGIDEATWSITSYLAANAIIIPMTGWLSRLFGRKRYLIFSVTLFTLSSLLCGISWNIQSLVFFRILQGFAGGSLQPLSQSILLETFPPRQHGMAMAIFGVGIMFGPIIGPLLGGWITDNWSWHWIFYINIPIGIFSILMSMLFIVDPQYMKRTKMKIDYWGLVCLAVGIGCLQLMLDRGERLDWFASPLILWLGVLSVSALIIFVCVELFAEHPIVDFKAFKNFSFTLGNIIIFFVLMNLFGSIVILPIYLQNLMGYTATLAGIILGPGGIATLLTMPLVGRLMTRINPKVIIFGGILLTTYATLLMSQFSLATDFSTILWPRIFLGVGMGCIFIPMTTLTLSGMKKEEMGNATSIYNLVRNVGGSFGVAIVTTMLTRRAQFHQGRLVDHLGSTDLNFIWNSSRISQILQYKGIDSVQGSLGLIYDKLLREAAMMAFNDVFYFLCMTMILMLPLAFFMRTIKYSSADDHHT
jgi:DHA2 family multidrug resistance protein